MHIIIFKYLVQNFSVSEMAHVLLVNPDHVERYGTQPEIQNETLFNSVTIWCLTKTSRYGSQP